MTKKLLPAEESYQRLREMILREEVLPNERLVELEFAERLGTNRANIRKALVRLEKEGLVVMEPFRGAHVRRITEDEAIEILEVRCALEALLVRHAAQRANDQDRAELHRLQEEARASLSYGEPLQVGRLTRKVRVAMWRISGHVTGQRAFDRLNSQLVRIWFHASLLPGRVEEIVSQLDDVIAAVCANRPDDAVLCMHRYHQSAMLALMATVQSKRASRQAEQLI